MKFGSVEWQEVEALRKDFNIELIHQDEILDFRALQGHSGRNLSDFSLQNNLLILNNFFEYILHIRCFSILIPSQIQDWYRKDNLSVRQTVFFTFVDLVNKEHKDPINIDLEAPRSAW